MTTDNSSINRQACAWIAKLHGQPSVDDVQRLHHWMAQSPAHRAEIRQVAELWGELDILTELAAVTPATKVRGFKVRGFGALVAHLISPLKHLPQAWHRPAYLSISALVVTVTLTISVLLQNSNHYSTAVGEQQLVSLEDGSTVLLNTNSAIRVNYSEQSRSISLLRGQAHFDVMPNKARPFTVAAGNGLVRALGTAFSVYLQPNTLDVTVTEGVIELSAVIAAPVSSPRANTESSGTVAEHTEAPVPQPSVTPLSQVSAGQHIQLNQQTHQIDQLVSIQAPEFLQQLAWHQGLVQFAGDPLEEVVAEISRYTELDIIIRDPAIRQLRIGGFFKVGETDKMLQALEASFGIQVHREGKNQVYLTAAK